MNRVAEQRKKQADWHESMAASERAATARRVELVEVDGSVVTVGGGAVVFDFGGFGVQTANQLAGMLRHTAQLTIEIGERA